MQKIITLSSDFGVQSQGVGIMEGVICEICPQARVIHLMHGLPDFDISYAARTMEAAIYMPVGIHVCIVDPGVGTSRKGIIIKTKRGDYFIGPDNGVFRPALTIFGFDSCVEITNPKYMRHPVSDIFHGRDIFAPCAAYLAKGIKMQEFGKKLNLGELAKAPYAEAKISDKIIDAKIISINKFGSLHLNITHKAWDLFKAGKMVRIGFGDKKLAILVARTFGVVPPGKELIMKDDYNRVEIAINMGNFSKKHELSIGDKIRIEKI